MEVTLEQAYEAALATIGRLTVEQHFQRVQLEAQAAEIRRLTEPDDSES